MNEEWRDIPGYEGKYQVNISTKEGKCRSLNWKHTGQIKELSNKPNKIHNRIIWSLYKNGVETHQQAAVFIAKAFPELVQNEYFDGAMIDHIDTDRLNNHPSNLRWVTSKGNANNSQTLLNKRDVMINRKDRSKPVEQYKGDVLIAHYDSIMEAERQTGIAHQNINSVCCNKPGYKTAGGYIWRYA